jgi:hypothetical protein
MRPNCEILPYLVTLIYVQVELQASCDMIVVLVTVVDLKVRVYPASWWCECLETKAPRHVFVEMKVSRKLTFIFII